MSSSFYPLDIFCVFLFLSGPVPYSPSSFWSATRSPYIHMCPSVYPPYIIVLSFFLRAGAVQSLLVLVRHSSSKRLT